MQTTAGPTVPVRYSCKRCGFVDRIVNVRERYEAEHISGWVELVRVEIGKDHDAAAPKCGSYMVDVKIPLVREGQPIGRALRQ